MTKRFVIVPIEDAIDNYRMINQSVSRNFDEVRKSIDGTKYLFSFISDVVPDSFLSYRVYSESEIKDVLNTVEWNADV